MIHWNVEPDIFTVGPLRLRWYGLMFLVGFTLGYRIVKKMCIREGKPVLPLDNLLVYLVAGTTIGARLGHCFFYEPDYFLAHPLEIFMIWKGGLASHGGGIGVMIALWLFSRKHREFPLVWLMDRIAIPVALTGGFIRIGNLMNSEIIGRPTNAPWAFVFEKVDQIPRHPTQIYESLSYFLVFFISYFIYRKNPKSPRGLLLGVVFVGLFVSRIIWEFFKENQESFESGMILNMGQILSIPFIIFGTFLIVRALREETISK
jgi:phosphatidylglycerol:prolipoprotein diacylglycerol transferase